MKKIFLFHIVAFLFFTCSSNIPDSINGNKIVFTWDENPFDDTVGTVTETIADLTVTVTAPLSEHTHSVGYFNILDFDNFSNGNVVVSFHKETSMTFTFNKPVNVETILALSGDNNKIDYTFTPLESNNNDVVFQTLNLGVDVSHVTAKLNWSNITSFTVTSSTPTHFGFDFLTVIDSSEL